MSRDAVLVAVAGVVALLMVALVVMAVIVFMQVQTKRRLRDEAARSHKAMVWALRRHEVVEDECRHLVERRLPALVDVIARSHPGVAVPGLRYAELAGSVADVCFEKVERLLHEAVGSVREDIALAARAGVRGAVDEAQTHLVRCQMKIFEEFDKYPQDSPYHQSLMDFDHMVTLAVHMLQRLRILAGSWAGVQRANCTFREIVESARGRIRAYERVDYTYIPNTGEVFVEGRVVEPVTVALAELLSNATSWSSDRVSVSVLAVQTGYCVMVEDNGVGLNASQRESAERLLSDSAVLDVTNLRHDRKLGFAVMGRLAREYGFHVDVSSPSAGGGVRAVLRVPSTLLTEEAPAAPTQVASPKPVLAESAETVPTSGVGIAGIETLTPSPEPSPNAVPTTVQQAAEASSTSTATTSALPRRQRRQPRHGASVEMAVIDTSDPVAIADRVSGLGQVIQASLEMDKETNADE